MATSSFSVFIIIILRAMKKIPVNSTVTVIALAILAYIGYTIWIGWEETFAAILRLGIQGWVIILSLSLVNYILRFVRWQWYLSSTDYQNLSLWRSFRYYLVGFAFTTTPGKVGEMVRSLFLHQHHVPYTASLSMYFVERLSDLLTMILLAALVLWHFEGYEKWLIVPVSGAILLLTLLQQRHLLQWIQTKIQRFFSTSVSRLFDHLMELALHSRQLVQFRFLYGGLGLGLVAWGAEGIGFYYVLQALDMPGDVFVATGIYAMSVIIGALSFLPGGLGGTEAAMLIFLMALGASHEEALAATLICRFATLWFAVILGAMAMVGLPLKLGERDLT